MESGNKEVWPSHAAWIVAGAAVGIAAFTYLTRRAKAGKPVWDPNSILDACERAAARLDEILLGESLLKEAV